MSGVRAPGSLPVSPLAVGVSSMKVKFAIIGTAVVLLVGGGVVGGWAYTQERAADQAVADTQATLEQIAGVKAALARQVAEAKATAGLVEGKVADPSTYDALLVAISDAEVLTALEAAAASDAMPRADAEAALEAARAVLALVDDGGEPLMVAVQAAQESHDAYLLDQATAAAEQARVDLVAVIETGEQVLADTEGRVDDNAVRQTLRDALDAAIAARDAEPEATVASQDAAKTARDAAAGPVVDAQAQVTVAVAARDARIEAERQAAEEAARKAAAEKAAAEKAAAEKAAQQRAASKKTTGSTGSTKSTGGSGGSSGSSSEGSSSGSSGSSSGGSSSGGGSAGDGLTPQERANAYKGPRDNAGGGCDNPEGCVN